MLLAMLLAIAIEGECMGAAGIIGWEPMVVDEALGEIRGMAEVEMGRWCRCRRGLAVVVEDLTLCRLDVGNKRIRRHTLHKDGKAVHFIVVGVIVDLHSRARVVVGRGACGLADAFQGEKHCDLAGRRGPPPPNLMAKSLSFYLFGLLLANGLAVLFLPLGKAWGGKGRSTKEAWAKGGVNSRNLGLSNDHIPGHR